MKILYVEDDPDNGTLFVLLLKKSGHNVAWMQSAAVAFERLRSEQFDLLLVDVGLPDCDGKDFIRDARSMAIATPAVALTGYASAADVAACLEAGFNTHIAKPVLDLDGFVAELERLVATAAEADAPQ